MCSWKPLEGQGWSPDHPEPIAPFPHSGLSCSSVNNKSMTVCAMYSIFVKYIQKIFEKRAGMEPETDLFDLYKASIVGTGKSIDFYLICLKMFKVGYYPLMPLACACCLIYITVVYCNLIIHCHCYLI